MRKPTRFLWPLACLLGLVAAACSRPPALSTLGAGAGGAGVGGSGDSAAPETALDESAAVLAAQRGLRSFLDRIPAERRAGYGFATPDEVDRAQLGSPYQVWTADSPEGALRAVHEWRFPVTVDGEYRALLTVGEVGGTLKAVDLGAAGLAKELSQREKDRALPARARRVLLRLYALRADFVAFPGQASQIEDAAFEALASARALPRSPSGAVDLSQLRPWLRERFDAARSR